MGTGQRSAAVGFYLALVTARCLELVGHSGPVIVEGPFARNAPYLAMLGAASSSPVVPMDSTTGTSQGAALLVEAKAAPQRPKAALPAPEATMSEQLSAYALDWRARIAAR